MLELAPNKFKIGVLKTRPRTVNAKAIMVDKVILFPIKRSAFSRSPCPNLIEILAVLPTPTNIPQARIMVVIGSVMPTPVMASEPTSGIFPMKIRSTTLYRALTIIPTIAGIEY